MTAVFITATGTDIGKTFIAAGLIRHWRAAGRQIDAIKPVVTGFDLGEAQTSDTGILLAALDRPVTSAEIDRVSPWRFAAPLSPDMAASREHRCVDFDALVDFSRAAVAANTDTLLIEGIGGIMVPIDRKHTVLDWMIALQIPLVVVTGTYLGSLSHTLTCLDVLGRHGLAVKALVISDTLGSDITHQTTSATLLNFVRATPIVGIRRLPAGSTGAEIFADLAKMLDD